MIQSLILWSVVVGMNVAWAITSLLSGNIVLFVAHGCLLLIAIQQIHYKAKKLEGVVRVGRK